MSIDKHGQEYDLDPRITYFKKCLQEQDLALPILDKISKKTLCLQNYLLTDGNCRGLAAACEFLDYHLVNRFLFNNCGITGKQLALILEGAVLIKDFKSLIYKSSEVTEVSLQALVPILEKRLPNNLAELKLIDCKINSTQIEVLMSCLIERSQLKAFSLVNVHHSEKSFELLIVYMQNSETLEELDISWSIIKNEMWLHFMEALSFNRTLTTLTLAYNMLLEEQNYHVRREYNEY